MLDGSDAASAAFEAWRRESPEHAAAYDRVRAARAAAQRLADDPALLALRHETLARTMLARPPSRLRPRVVAAAMLLLAGAPLAALGIHHLSRPSAAELTAESFRTGVGQQADVTLPDGSIVTLDTASRLDVRFVDGGRHVRLAGQGWFRIKPSTTPFEIDADGRSLVADRGTFDVRTDPGFVRAFALDGQLTLSGSSSVAVQPGRLLTAHGSEVVIRTPDDAATFTGWHSGLLQFDDVPLAEAAGELDRYRHRPIRIADPHAAALRVSGSFRAAETPAFTDALAAGFPVRVRRDSEEVVVASR